MRLDRALRQAVIWGKILVSYLHMHPFSKLGIATKRTIFHSFLLPRAPDAVMHVLSMITSLGRVPHRLGRHTPAPYALSHLV